MNIKLSMAKHCVETEIKSLYNQKVSAFFKADEEARKGLDPQIDLLHRAIENFDFNGLRNRFPDLRGKSDADVRLYDTHSGQPGIRINGEDIETN